jgi:hypothetical protein
MVAKDCWIALRRLTDKDGDTRTYMWCVSEEKGLTCPRDRKAGKKPFELCAACFEAMPEGMFMKQVIKPGIIEPRAPSPEPLTLQQIWEKGDQMDAKNKDELRREATRRE